MTAYNQPSLFEQIKRSDEEGNEFWSARELAKVLEYTEYRHFKPAIERAKESCKNSEWSVSDHFEDMHDMIEIGKGAIRKLENVRLSRTPVILLFKMQIRPKKWLP